MSGRLTRLQRLPEEFRDVIWVRCVCGGPRRVDVGTDGHGGLVDYPARCPVCSNKAARRWRLRLEVSSR